MTDSTITTEKHERSLWTPNLFAANGYQRRGETISPIKMCSSQPIDTIVLDSVWVSKEKYAYLVIAIVQFFL